MRPKILNLFAVVACCIVVPTAAFAAVFDAEAATEAYLATLKGAARAQSDAYFEGGYWLLLWGTLVAGVVAPVRGERVPASVRVSRGPRRGGHRR